jgi:hypothetical protein
MGDDLKKEIEATSQKMFEEDKKLAAVLTRKWMLEADANSRAVASLALGKCLAQHLAKTKGDQNRGHLWASMARAVHADLFVDDSLALAIYHLTLSEGSGMAAVEGLRLLASGIVARGYDRGDVADGTEKAIRALRELVGAMKASLDKERGKNEPT